MIIVTGGAGFIGSNIIKHLNKEQYTDILVVDNLTNSKKYANLIDLKITDFIDKTDFLTIITSKKNTLKNIKTIFHEGACSSTMMSNGQYVMNNNYQYSKHVLHYCLENKIPLLYASSAAVYGNQKKKFLENTEYERPINIYGYSKFLFDQYVRIILPQAKSQIFGGRYFNVYGPREQHKGCMSSIIFQIIHSIHKKKKPTLFFGSENFSRDFIHVNDISKINFWAWKKNLSGIFNIGTGISNSFTDIANIIFDLYNNKKKYAIQYINMPKQLKKSYQTFTEANITALRQSGYKKQLTPIHDGIKQYIDWLENNNQF